MQYHMQGTFVKSQPPVLCVIGIQNSIQAVNQLQTLSPWGTTVSDHLQWMREPLWNSRFPGEKFQYTTGMKEKYIYIYELYILERAGGTVWLHLYHPSPKVALLRAKRDHLGWRFPPQGVSESMWASPQLPQLCGILPKRLISLSSLPEYWVASCMTEVWEEAGKVADGTLAGTQILLTRSQTPSRSPLASPRTPCPWIPQCAHRHLNTPLPSPTYSPAPVCAPSLGRRLLNMCRKLTHICRRDHKTWALFSTAPWS